MKTFSTIIFGLVLFFASMLYINNVDFPSMSATHTISPTDTWYVLMHVAMSFYFFLDGARNKRLLSTVLGFGPILILWFDMYEYQLLHNIATATTIGLAILNIIWFNSKKERPVNIFLGGLAVSIFLLGYKIPSFNFFFAEGLVEVILGVGFVRRDWLKIK